MQAGGWDEAKSLINRAVICYSGGRYLFLAVELFYDFKIIA